MNSKLDFHTYSHNKIENLLGPLRMCCSATVLYCCSAILLKSYSAAVIKCCSIVFAMLKFVFKCIWVYEVSYLLTYIHTEPLLEVLADLKRASKCECQPIFSWIYNLHKYYALLDDSIWVRSFNLQHFITILSFANLLQSMA